MTILEFIVVIVAMSMAAKLIGARMAARDAQHHARPDPEAARASEEIRALKERIRVLERVVTDNHGSHDLDREIERLRDR